MKPVKPSRTTERAVPVGSGALLGVAACILASCFGISLIILIVGVTELDTLTTFGSLVTGTNLNRSENGGNNNNAANKSKKQTRGSIEKLTADCLRVDANAGGAGDSTNEQVITEINAASPNTSTNSLKNVAPTDRVIRIDVIIHVVRDQTPNGES